MKSSIGKGKKTKYKVSMAEAIREAELSRLREFKIPVEKTQWEKAAEMLKNCRIDLKPKGDRVIILPMQSEGKTAGGIIIPDTAKERPLKGLVVATGPGDEDHPVTCAVGELIMYGKYSGNEYLFEGQEFLIMRNSDISAEVLELGPKK